MAMDPPVDLAQAHHIPAGGEVLEVALLVIVGGADEGLGFDEAAGVDEPFDPLADRQAAAPVLPFDSVRAAHLARQPANIADVVHGPIPVHAGLPGLAR